MVFFNNAKPQNFMEKVQSWHFIFTKSQDFAHQTCVAHITKLSLINWTHMVKITP